MDRLITPDEAASLLRLSVYTMKDYARSGVIPAIKVGKAWRFSEQELTAWLAAQHTGPSVSTFGPAGGGQSIARDRAVEEAGRSDARDPYMKRVLESRRAAFAALDEIKKRIEPFNVDALVEEAKRERDERADRWLKKEDGR